MQLCRFNERGLRAFGDFLDRLRSDPTQPVPRSLLTDPHLTQPLDPPIEAQPRPFETRMEFTRWLHDAAAHADTHVPRGDAGFWAWLTLALFDQVCPEKNGKRKAGELARYIPMFDDWKRRYRHLLATPYAVFFVHQDDPGRAALILFSPLHILGEITEQFASRQELVSCPGTLALASHLFVGTANRGLRSGASGKAARRLGKLLNQFQRTWDITIMSPSEAAAILPREFDRFKNAAETQAGATVP